MDIPQQTLQLRLAADAARATLNQLQQEYARLIRRVDTMSESMQLLQGVIDAWERLNPERDPLNQQLVRIDQELRATHPPDPWPAREQIVEQVHRTLQKGTPLSPQEAHAALDARQRGVYSLNVVSMALRLGTEAGRYVYNGRTGKYRIAG